MFEQTAAVSSNETQHPTLRRYSSLGSQSKTEVSDTSQSTMTYLSEKVSEVGKSPSDPSWERSSTGNLPKKFWEDEVPETSSPPKDLSDRRIKFAETMINGNSADEDVFQQSTHGEEYKEHNGVQLNIEEEHVPLGVPKTKSSGVRGRRVSPASQQVNEGGDNDAHGTDDGSALVSLQRTRSRKSLHEIFGVNPPSSEEYGRQSSQISGGGSPSPGPGSPAGDGVTPAPPPPPPFPAAAAPPAPPPPPPPGCGALPAVRLSTEIPESRGGGRGGPSGGCYEPPAAIQNAMMTKDKKPFTYTPGGLDLSQIRSPRMQRRITRNANAEGVPEQPVQQKTSPLAQGQLPPSAVAAMQPQMAVPVFPTGNQQMSSPVPPPPPQPQIQSQPLPQKITTPVQAHPQPHKIPAPPPQPQPVVQNQSVSPTSYTPAAHPPQWSPTQVKPATQNEPGSIYVPPVSPPQGGRAQVGSIYIPPVQQQQQDQQKTASPLSPVSLNKAPTPWMSQRQQQQQVPAWVNREEPSVQRQPPTSVPPAPPGTRIIPIHVEGREPPVQPNKSAPSTTSQQPNTRIIPIQMEGETAPAQSKQPSQQNHMQQRQPVYVHNKFNPPSASPTSPVPRSPVANENVAEQNPRQLQQQQSWGPPGANGTPVQSRSFRVLQKITDTDNTDAGNENTQHTDYPYANQSTQGVPVQQLRKLQLSDDDRALMNKFKAQVAEESHLLEEENPRYRGGHIPSRVFKMLDESVPPSPVQSQGPQQRPASVQPATESPQPYIPPSEQQVPEPKKYTGGCIPSRSFRMLQAMTAPENCGPGQSDM